MTRVTQTHAARSTAIDHARGVGIVLVVVGHALRGLRNAKLLPDSPAVAFVDAFIYAFHMPLFFFLSGWFAEKSLRSAPRAFFSSRFDSIVYPYLIWSVLQTAIQIALSGYTNATASVSDLVAVVYRPPMQFWFLYALFLIQALNYGLSRLGLPPRARLAIALVAQVWALLPYGGFGPWQPLLQAALFAPYFVVGSMLGPTLAPRLPEVKPARASLVVVAGFGFVALGASTHSSLLLEGLFSVLLASAGTAATLMLATLLARVPALAWNTTLGERSLEIFVMHTLVSAATRIALEKVLHVRDPALHLVLGTVTGLAVPVAFVASSPKVGVLFRTRRSTPAVAVDSQAAPRSTVTEAVGSPGSRS